MRRPAPSGALRLAVLDMIGTTVEAGTVVRDAFEAAFLERGLELAKDDVERVRGRSKHDAVAELVAARAPAAPDRGRLVDEIHEAFVAGLRARLARDARPIPGATGLFGWLAGRGVAVVLTTGLDRETASVLAQALGWDVPGSPAVLTDDDVASGRPSPDLIHLAMRRSGVADPRTVLNVGDTTSDLASARAAGVRWSVGVLTGAHSRDRLAAQPHSALLDSVADLPDWLLEQGALG